MDIVTIQSLFETTISATPNMTKHFPLARKSDGEKPGYLHEATDDLWTGFFLGFQAARKLIKQEAS